MPIKPSAGLLFLFLAVFLSPFELRAADTAASAEAAALLANYEGRPRVLAVRLQLEESITVDGRFDEPAWQRAAPAAGFVQQDPANGQPSTERTEVRFVYSADSLYMGIFCYDSNPAGIMGNQMLRDGFLSSDDRFMWVFDPFLNGRTGYFFEINPGGALGDSLIGGDGQGRAWDGVWMAKVRKTEEGWFVEVEFPFKTLNFDPAAPAWGVNFQRTVRRKREETLWTAWIRNQNLQSLRNAGLLMGLDEATQGHGLDFRPFFVGNFTQAPGQGRPEGMLRGKYGGDMFYNITPQLRANLTINTDFAETEVDQRQVNLTQFPLFFPERRAFFLEGSGFFDFARWQGNNSVVPFFSRRIGLSAGTPQRIEYGTKVTGQIGRYDLGALQVRTAPTGNLRGEDFSVLRAKRRFFRESFFGGLYTRRAQRSANDLTPLFDPRQTLGGDFYLATSRFHGNQNLQFSGFYLWTSNLDSPATRGKGTSAYGLRVDYPNDRWQLRAAMREAQEAYDPAVGFVDRRAIRRWETTTFFRPRPRDPRRVRQYFYGVNTNLITALDNTVLTREVVLEPFGMQLQTGDQVQVQVTHTFDRLAFPFVFPTGITLPTGSSYGFLRYSISGNTTNQRLVAITFNYSNGQFYTGTRRDFQFGFEIRPKPGVLIGLNNQWNRIRLREGRFSTRLSRLDVNWMFTPWISYLNNVQYDNQSRVLGWQSRFRWIIKPGNDLYLVYTHNWVDELGEGGRQTLNRGLATKITYIRRF